MGSPRRYECLGGPLCGRRVAKTVNMESFICHDNDKVTHFYRLIRVTDDARENGVTYYHYCGTNHKTAYTRPPTLLMPREKYKPLKRKR